MYKTLSPGAIGIRGQSLQENLSLAAQTGFEGLDFSIQEAAQIAEAHGVDAVRALFEDAGVKYGAWGAPVNWQGEGWRDDVAALPKLAELAAELGADRCSTWCPPTSTERAFDANFAWHVERLGAIAEVLKTFGIRFGIEFIGPQSLRPADQHDFIHNMESMLALAAAIGTGNVGLLLDAWHLYTSGGAVDDLDKISNADIVNVHVNDAPLGLTMATYNDHDRRLPTETGVLPIEAFMKKLIELGYDGPVTPEPFSKRLNAMDDPLEAARETAARMTRLWQVAGLA
ncbi:MAG: sugar phosphate isomerase/epimerase [Chloroflexota bacterium]|nr:sugar phosphate isomerase/epimerase [Chloroflexota bacterium]